MSFRVLCNAMACYRMEHLPSWYFQKTQLNGGLPRWLPDMQRNCSMHVFRGLSIRRHWAGSNALAVVTGAFHHGC
jgi:hypothetical protein